MLLDINQAKREMKAVVNKREVKVHRLHKNNHTIILKLNLLIKLLQAITPTELVIFKINGFIDLGG